MPQGLVTRQSAPPRQAPASSGPRQAALPKTAVQEAMRPNSKTRQDMECELGDFTAFHNFVHAYITSRCELSRFINVGFGCVISLLPATAKRTR